MAIWFTSDTHFNHERVLTLSNRPFKDVAEMEDVLVANWNARVQQGDTVYHLGDFAMHPRDEIPRILSRLNGRVVLVAGNHDHKRTLFHFDTNYKTVDLYIDGEFGAYQGVWVHMVHNPAQARPQTPRPLREGEHSIVLCGHVHEKWACIKAGGTVPADDTPDHEYKSDAFVAQHDYYNVGVDVRGFKPVSLAEILAGA